jgi:HEAT repeat protein
MKVGTRRWAGLLVLVAALVLPAAGQAPAAQGDDEELKLLALNGLRQAEPEKAVPLLDKFLRENHSARLKERALAVLAGFETAPARAVVARVARNDAEPELQLKAVRYLGRFEGPEARKELVEIYGTAKSAEVKRAVIRALSGAEDVAGILSIARSESDPEVRDYAIRQLGSLQALGALQQAYQTLADTSARLSVIQALRTAGDVPQLATLARGEAEMALRREAIRGLSGTDRAQSAQALRELYAAEKEPELRKEILRGLARHGDVAGLIAIARQETDPELKKYAVGRIAQSKSKEAADFLVELLAK